MIGHACATAPLIDAYSEEIVCEEPLLTVDRQMGLNIVHPEGKVHICAF